MAHRDSSTSQSLPLASRGYHADMPTPRTSAARKALRQGQSAAIERPDLSRPPGYVHLMPPAGMTDAARSYFEFYAAQMAALRTSRLVDAPALVELCSVLADLDALRAELASYGSSSYQSVASNGAVIWKPYPALRRPQTHPAGRAP